MTTTTLIKNQKKTYGPKIIDYYGKKCRMVVTIRHDDECGNGHNTFSVTADITSQTGRFEAGGCLHDEVRKHFPKLAKFIKWHLCSTDGPMHYPANAVYHASDRDCHGRSAGDVSRLEYAVKFGNSPVSHDVKESFWNFLKERKGTGNFTVLGFKHDRDEKTFGTHYTFAGFGERWHECPFSDKSKADEWCEAMNSCSVEFVRRPIEFSAGKERDLVAARHAACWPDATDEELKSPALRQMLLDRLPGLLQEFQAAVEELGFTY